MDTKSIGFTVLAALVLSIQILTTVGWGQVGICYGRTADNLPSPANTVALYKRSHPASSIRMYEPFADMLNALRGLGLDVAVGPKNEEIQALAENPSYAGDWVNTWILSYINDVSIKWITIGNEIVPGDGKMAPSVAAAIRNINAALRNNGLSRISVTTVLSGAALTDTYPPSAARFAPDVTEIMTEISSILLETNSPLMVNIHPYFAYASDPDHLPLDYVTFRSESCTVFDGNLKYCNLFEAMVDGYNAALEKINFGSVRVTVGESGWPTRGNPPYKSVENALAYNRGLLAYVVRAAGTPQRPATPLDTFFFEMFTEDQKQGEVEQSFGYYTPDMVPVYPLWWT